MTLLDARSPDGAAHTAHVFPTADAATAARILPAATADSSPPRIRSTVVGFAPAFVPYADGLALQAAATVRLEAGADRGELLLLEHEAVYTAGRRALPEEHPIDGTPVVPVSRGGKVTWHGPGQLVGYPIVRLREPRAVVDFAHALERELIETARALGVEALAVPGRTGVWAVDRGAPVKIGQIGLSARRGVIGHGFALNCSNALEPFTAIVPCGITDAGVGSLSSVLGRRVEPADALPELLPRLERLLEELAS